MTSQSLIALIKSHAEPASNYVLDGNCDVVSVQEIESIIRQHEADTMGATGVSAASGETEGFVTRKDTDTVASASPSEIRLIKDEPDTLIMACEEVLRLMDKWANHHAYSLNCRNAVNKLRQEMQKHLRTPKREASEDWPDLRGETETVLTWAHNVCMDCQNLPKDDKAMHPIQVFYLRILKESVDKLEKARSDRVLNYVRKRTNRIEDGARK